MTACFSSPSLLSDIGRRKHVYTHSLTHARVNERMKERMAFMFVEVATRLQRERRGEPCVIGLVLLDI